MAINNQATISLKQVTISGDIFLLDKHTQCYFPINFIVNLLIFQWPKQTVEIIGKQPELDGVNTEV